MILTIRPAVRDDAVWIGQNLRDEDRREVETASGRPVEQVLLEAFYVSRQCYTIRLNLAGAIDEHPAAIFGVSDDPNTPGLGVMWLLATERIRNGALAVLREAPKWLDHFNLMYTTGIHNYVDTRNSLHIRWLMLTGFTFEEARMINGVPFVHAFRKT